MNLINQMLGNPFNEEFVYENINTAPLSSSDCRFVQNPNLDNKEALVKRIFGEQSLCLDPRDPKPKLLYLMAKHDPNHAFLIKSCETVEEFLEEYEGDTNPYSVQIYSTLKITKELASQGEEFAISDLEIFEKYHREGVGAGIDRLLNGLNKDYDLRFKVIHTNQQMCEEIAAASKINNLKSLIIQAHGNPVNMYFSDTELLVQHPWDNKQLMGYNITGEGQQNHIFFNLDKKCFSGLDKDMAITLISCETGAYKDSLASTISRVSQRYVWAPKQSIILSSVELSSDIPTVPTFKSEDGTSDETCLFSPEGSMLCGEKAKIPSDEKNYAAALLLGAAVTYCFYKFVLKR